VSRLLHPHSPSLRSCRRLVAALGLILSFGLWLTAVSHATSDRFVYSVKGCPCGIGSWGQGQLAEADVGTVANVRTLPITLCCNSTGENWFVSPNGREIAYEHRPSGSLTSSVYITDRSGANQQLILEQGQVFGFDPTGTKLLLGSSVSPCSGICTVNTNGTNLVRIPNATALASFSSDGTRLVWAALGKTKKTEAVDNIFVANADGSGAKQITNFEWRGTPPGVQTESGEQPQWGPGNTIAFVAYTEPKNGGQEVLWKINSDGSGLSKIPNSPPPVSYSVTPTFELNVTGGCEVVTMTFEGTNKQKVSNTCTNGESKEMIVQYRAPSESVKLFDALAARYEPVLRFDTAEEWRPLNIEKFFAEDQHHLCEEGGSCESTPLTSSVDLNKKRKANAYIDVAGTRLSEGGSETTYHSPYAECTASGLRDCDSGPRSAIYYRDAGVFGGYEYIDYWYFYRANYFWESADFHEGDWEGATVAPSLTGDTFDYAAFSQHGKYFAYARSVLRCEDQPDQEGKAPPAGSCGTTGWRVDDLPANGDHANYTTPCSEKTFEGWLIGECRSNNGVAERERGYDGTKQWGNAYSDPSASLLKIPPLGTESWIDWPGKWGSPKLTIEEGDGPASPGNQAFSIECAGLNNEAGCETGPRTSSVRHGQATPWGSVPSPGLTAVSCGNWAGAGIAAVACNPKELRKAVLGGRVGSTPDLQMSVAAAGVTAGGRGIAQFASRQPLHDGSEMRLGGNVTPETEVLVRARAGQRRLLLASFRPGRTAARARAAKASSLRLRLRVVHAADGRLTMYLGGVRAASVERLR
jgi:hypothetical protein